MAIVRGVAFQITNILRDLREDAAKGRLYLPREDLELVGITREELYEGRGGSKFIQLVHHQIARVESYYEDSALLESRLEPDSRPTMVAMTEIYRGLLAKIAQEPERVLRERVSLSLIHKLRIGWARPGRCDARRGCNQIFYVPSADLRLRGSDDLIREAASGRQTCLFRIRKNVIVIGGGLAGMACAVALQSVGADVTLIEARKTLGGRAGSFEDPQTGEQLDNCQHVLLGCCRNLIDFYRRIGADSLIEFDRNIHFRDESGRRHDLYGLDSLPAPFHLAPALLGFSALTLAERWKLSEAMLHMAQTSRDDVADISFGEWLDAHGQPESLVRKFYDTVVISGLNEETRRRALLMRSRFFRNRCWRIDRRMLWGCRRRRWENCTESFTAPGSGLGRARRRFGLTGIA